MRVRTNYSPVLASRSVVTTDQRRSQVANNSVLHFAALLQISRRCFWPMSPQATSTPKHRTACLMR